MITVISDNTFKCHVLKLIVQTYRDQIGHYKNMIRKYRL